MEINLYHRNYVQAIDYADDATCGAPTWIGKGLTCVCFKRKGNYQRICINLTPLQASNPMTETG